MGDIVCGGDGRVQCSTSLGGRGPGPPPHPLIGSCTRAIIVQRNFQSKP